MTKQTQIGAGSVPPPRVDRTKRDELRRATREAIDKARVADQQADRLRAIIKHTSS